VQEGRAGLLGSYVVWHKRNKADIWKLGTLLNTVQVSLYLHITHTCRHLHTHTDTQGCAMGPPMSPWRCGLMAHPVSGVEWSGETLILTLDDLESHIVVNVSSTLTNITIWFVAALCLIVDVRTDRCMDGRTDIFTGFIRSSV